MRDFCGTPPILNAKIFNLLGPIFCEISHSLSEFPDQTRHLLAGHAMRNLCFAWCVRHILSSGMGYHSRREIRGEDIGGDGEI